jgi:hypothetical protein
VLFSLATITSCTSNDVKEISGTILFHNNGAHSFNINADHIKATITMVGPNNGEFFVFEDVSLFRTVDYTARIGESSSTTTKTELLNNLVVMYEARSGENGQVSINYCYISFTNHLFQYTLQIIPISLFTFVFYLFIINLLQLP